MVFHWRVPDYRLKARVKANGQAIDPAGVKIGMIPWTGLPPCKAQTPSRSSLCLNCCASCSRTGGASTLRVS